MVYQGAIATRYMYLVLYLITLRVAGDGVPAVHSDGGDSPGRYKYIRACNYNYNNNK